ncbi:glycolate oxidase subunit GlcE [Sphingomonas glacialis]|uniref:Glycolate oxidase subunit GlcE n=2 Tax=Sphingomonas glacialis TaxID=658225 RepID=A0A502FSA3_9SPHN|nr:glycolate oxidase subunit GlcE [Sphingomonas glacialis]
MLRPTDIGELCDLVAAFAGKDDRLCLRGGGSKDAIGAPTPDVTVVDMRGFSGVVDYDPPELVLTVRAGTPLAEVQALVAAENQMLAFDPEGLGTTIGGVIAAGMAGPLRLTRGGVRDHLLGFEAVSGRGERFVAGGKVVKNVTGFDLSKLMAGSWGRLAALTEVTLKVVPRPQLQQTLLLRGLDPAAAVAVMASALGTPAELSAAAHLAWHGEPVTALRLDGFAPSVAARRAMLARDALAALEPIDDDEGDALWDAVRHVRPLASAPILWRIVVAPSKAPGVIIALPGAAWLLDWAGGLLWLASDSDPADIRRVAEAGGGHAMLVRGDTALRGAVSAFHPRSPALTALETRVRRAFDPAGVFETGRF